MRAWLGLVRHHPSVFSPGRGGDIQTRMKVFRKTGHTVPITALEGTTMQNDRADCVVLPLPAAGPDGRLNAPLAAGGHELAEILDARSRWASARPSRPKPTTSTRASWRVMGSSSMASWSLKSATLRCSRATSGYAMKNSWKSESSCSGRDRKNGCSCSSPQTRIINI